MKEVSKIQKSVFIIIIATALILLTFLIPKHQQNCIMGPHGSVCYNQNVKGIGYPIFYGENWDGDVVNNAYFNPINLIINIIASLIISFIALTIFEKSITYKMK
jgi:hypothetical protein